MEIEFDNWLEKLQIFLLILKLKSRFSLCCYICFVQGWNLTRKGFQAFSLKFLQKYVKTKKLFDTFWGLTEGLPLGPKLDSAPPRISYSSNSRAGEARKGSLFYSNQRCQSHLVSYSDKKAFNSSENWCGKSERSIEWQHLTGSPSGPNSNLAWDTERPPRATSSLTCYLGKKPPNPQRHWTLDTGAPGTYTTGVSKIYAWASRRGMPVCGRKYCICNFCIVYNAMQVWTPIERIIPSAM